MIRVPRPKLSFIKVYIDNKLIPKTISGITTGIYNKLLINPLPLKSYLYNPIAARVPITVDTTVLVTATIKVFFRAASKVVLVNKILYHFNVKPSNIIFNLESLKEKATRASIG